MIDALTALLGAENVLTAKEDLVPYSFDGTATFRELPVAVVFPRTTEEVARCVKICREHQTPIITRGSGTGLSGGTVPTPGAIVLCLCLSYKSDAADDLPCVALGARRTIKKKTYRP